MMSADDKTVVRSAVEIETFVVVFFNWASWGIKGSFVIARSDLCRWLAV